MLESGAQSELPRMHTAFFLPFLHFFAVLGWWAVVVGGADLAPFNETNETSLNLFNYKVV